MEEQQQHDDTDLFDYLRVTWKHKWLVLLIVAVGVAATGLASLMMTPIFEARAVIIPAGALSKDQGAAASLLAMQFGITPPTTPASVEIVNLLKSNILREKLIRRYNLLPLFFTKEEMQHMTENQATWMGIRYLQTALTVNFSQKDNLITLSLQFKDPQKAAELLSCALTELNNHMSGEAKRVADTNKSYLEAQLDKTSDPYIKAKVYTLIAQQIETSVMAEVKENFAFKVLDPPKVPDRRIKPQRTRMVVMALVVSLLLGILAALGKEYLKKTEGT